MRKPLALFAVVVLFAVVAVAHRGEEHLMGTVTKVSDKSITIEDKDKKAIEVTVTTNTKCIKGDATVALKDLKVGDRVVIHAKKSGNKLVATMVKIGVAAPAHKY